MLGLLKKEFLTYRSNQHVMVWIGDALTFLVCLCIGNSIGLSIYVLVIMPLAASSVSVALFEADGKVAFDRYAISLPLKKLQIVGSRFLFLLCFIAFYTCCILLFTILYASIHEGFSFSDSIMIAYGGILSMLMMSFINLAGSYMLGFQGGAIIMSFFYFLIIGGAAIFGLLAKNGTFNLLDFLILHPNLIWVFATIIVLFIVLFAFALACIAYQWKHR